MIAGASIDMGNLGAVITDYPACSCFVAGFLVGLILSLLIRARKGAR